MKMTFSNWPNAVSKIAGGCVLIAGAVFLAGWCFDVPALKSIFPSWPKMSPLTAVSFALGGLSLWCVASATQRKTGLIRVSQICTAVIVFIALFRLGDYLFGWNLNFDTLGFHDSTGISSPARMSRSTAVDFLLLGGALLLAGSSRLIRTFQFLTLSAVLISLLGFSHFVFGGAPLPLFAHMAMHTAGLMLLLGAGIFCTRTDGGLMALLVSDSTGGLLARRMLPPAVFIPLTLGWLRLKAQQAGWLDMETSVSLYALSNVAVFCALVWISARLLHRSDSKRKRAEEGIRQLNNELELRVVKRTAELEAANKELEAFSYSVSHDLRAPLRAVNGFAGIVLEDFSAQLPEEGRGYLERIRKGGQRMGELIDDLLAFSRLSRQAVNRQNVNTVRLVQNVLDELKPQREGRQIEIKVGELPACHGDPALLKQVWVNLISNAVKYTRGREPAIIEIGCTRENNEDVYFVRDNGAGFDMQYANKLFGVFQRLHRASEFEGTGVGLAIVQRIVHRHGGRVWAQAEVNHGATFHFTLEGENKP